MKPVVYGNRNIAGHRIKVARTMLKPPLTQEDLIARMQFEGITISINMMSRIETGDRYVTDVELVASLKSLKFLHHGYLKKQMYLINRNNRL